MSTTIKVKVIKSGVSAKEVEVLEGATVQAAITAAEFGTDTDYSMSVNGLGAGLSSVVSDGDIITLTKKIEGGVL